MRARRGNPSDLSPEEEAMVASALCRPRRRLLRVVRPAARHPELGKDCSGCGSPRHALHGQCPVCLLLSAGEVVSPAPFANCPAGPVPRLQGRAAGQPSEEAA